MAQVWETGPENQGELLVLLALADFADDKGVCFPSMRRVAQKARVKERSAVRIVRRLEQAGYLKTVVGGGRNGCNKYTINPDPRSPLTESHPDPDAQKPCPTGHPPPDRSVTRTIIEPSIEPSKITPTPFDVLVEVLRPETAKDFIAHRKAMRKPITEVAAKRIVSRNDGLFLASSGFRH